jgi:sugar-phosphatase
MFRAFLFDLDGTLVDSSEAVFRVLRRWCARHGLDPVAAMEKGRGSRLVDLIPRLVPHLDPAAEVDDFERQEAAEVEGLQAIAGAADFLAGIPSGSWAIVTSGSVPVARPRLKACGLPEPAVLITAEMVSRGKPHPEPYLTAAARMGLAPEECLVFEDSDHGVRSALDAGCKVAVIGPHCTLEHPNIHLRAGDYRDLEVAAAATLAVRLRGR